MAVASDTRHAPMNQNHRKLTKMRAGASSSIDDSMMASLPSVIQPELLLSATANIPVMMPVANVTRNLASVWPVYLHDAIHARLVKMSAGPRSCCALH